MEMDESGLFGLGGLKLMVTIGIN